MVTAKLKLPYVRWRDGRPRWEPGPRVRSIGFRGEDLRHDDGRWYSLDEASSFALTRKDEIDKARKIGLHVVRRKGTGRRTRAKGFVYFIWSDNWIKIGYSLDPFRRVQDLVVGMPTGIRSLGAVPGTSKDEQRLHHALRSYRRHGEWFAAVGPVVQTMLKSIALGEVTLYQDTF